MKTSTTHVKITVDTSRFDRALSRLTMSMTLMRLKAMSAELAMMRLSLAKTRDKLEHLKQQRREQ